MNKSKFDELTNLYFDREISVAEIECLKEELAKNADRRREFQLHYRLHQATCSALSSAENPEFIHEVISVEESAVRGKHRPSVIFGFGMAACFLVLFLVSVSITRELADTTEELAAETSDSLGKNVYVDNAEPDVPLRKSVSPEFLFSAFSSDNSLLNEPFGRVDTGNLHQGNLYFHEMAEPSYLYEADALTPVIQEAGLLDHPYQTSHDSYWPTGFKSSLASFKSL